MKITKRTGVVIAIGVFLITGIYLYMNYSGIVDEKTQLKEQLNFTQLQLQEIRLETLSPQETELAEQLRQVTSTSREVVFTLSQPISNIDAVTVLYDVARTWGLQVNTLTSSGMANEILEGTTFSVISIDTEIEGDMPNLVNFITHLNNSYTTGVIRSVTITAPGSGNGTNAMASVRLAVYTYRGD